MTLVKGHLQGTPLVTKGGGQVAPFNIWHRSSQEQEPMLPMQGILMQVDPTLRSSVTCACQRVREKGINVVFLYETFYVAESFVLFLSWTKNTKEFYIFISSAKSRNNHKNSQILKKKEKKIKQKTQFCGKIVVFDIFQFSSCIFLF